MVTVGLWPEDEPELPEPEDELEALDPDDDLELPVRVDDPELAAREDDELPALRDDEEMTALRDDEALSAAEDDVLVCEEINTATARNRATAKPTTARRMACTRRLLAASLWATTVLGSRSGRERVRRGGTPSATAEELERVIVTSI